MDEVKVITLRNVSFSYEHESIFKDINLDIYNGEFVCITGANGTGKSTLLKLITGILSPNSGEIYVNGEVAKNLPHPGVAYLSQREEFNPGFPATVEEIVGLGLRHSKNKNELVTEALRKVDMIPYRKKLIGDLSGGQQQRILISKSLINNPAILFLDEPTSGIDRDGCKSICCLLGDINKNYGLTIVMVTHDLVTVKDHATRIVDFNNLRDMTIETIS